MVSTHNPARSGVTLVELIISTAVVGIIMLGVMSAEYAIRKQGEAAFNSSNSAIRAQVILDHVLHNAAQAVGSAADPGVVINPFGWANTFCFRTSMAGPSWSCYSKVPAGLQYTVGTTIAATIVSDPIVGVPCGTVLMDVSNPASCIYVQFTQNTAAGAQQMVFSAKVSVPGNSAADPIKTVSGSVSPAGQSM